MNYHSNQQTIAGADDLRLRAPNTKRAVRVIETEKKLQAYINANDFDEDYVIDLWEMFNDCGFVEVDE